MQKYQLLYTNGVLKNCYKYLSFSVFGVLT